MNHVTVWLHSRFLYRFGHENALTKISYHNPHREKDPYPYEHPSHLKTYHFGEIRPNKNENKMDERHNGFVPPLPSLSNLLRGTDQRAEESFEEGVPDGDGKPGKTTTTS